MARGNILERGEQQTRFAERTLNEVHKGAEGIRRLVEAEKSLAITKDELVPIAIIFGLADVFLRSLRDQVRNLDGGQQAVSTIGQAVYGFMEEFMGTGSQRDSGTDTPKIIDARST
ncbi:MAG: hypothetical protein JRD89_15610 [Deltaproteobacteria bacterium]|nr:hypothetical protein [Deltaproteobacteria bacterium]